MAATVKFQRRLGDRPAAQTDFKVGTNAESFGAATGRAFQTLGAGLETVSQAVGMRAAIRNDTEAREGDEMFRDRVRPLVYGEGGFTQQEGENASEGAMVRSMEDVERIRQEIASGITNPEAREAFLARTSARTDAIQDDMAQHQTAAEKARAEAAYTATVEGHRQDALMSNTDTGFQRSMEEAVAEQTTYMAMRGMTDKEVVDGAALELRSSLVRDRAIQTSATDPVKAAALVDQAVKNGWIRAEDAHDLKTNLKPLLHKKQANDFADQYTTLPGQGNDRITQSESGGRTDAQNPDSTAAGPSQFLDGTYLDQVRQMRQSGAPGAEMFEGMSEAEILATRKDPSGAFDAAVRRHWDAQNEGILREHGFATTNDNMYALHHFGQTGGRRFLQAVRNNPGVSAASLFGSDWAKMVRDNSWMRADMTVGQMDHWIENRVGTNPYMGMTGQPRFDAAGAYAAAQAIEDPELRAATMAEIASREAAQNNMIRATREEALEGVFTEYETNGTSDLSMEQRLAMGRSGVTAFEAYVLQSEAGTLVTNEVRYGELTTEAARDPMAFMSRDLNEERGNFSKADFRKLMDMQNGMVAGAAGAAADADKAFKTTGVVKVEATAGELYDRVRASGTNDRISPSKSNDKNDQRAAAERMQIQRQMNEWAMSFYEQNKREPNRLEIEDQFAFLTLPTRETREGEFGKNDTFVAMGAFAQDGTVIERVVDYDDIPSDERSDIAMVYASTYGVPPTQDQIADFYEMMIAGRAGADTGMSMANVPEEVRSAILAADPSFTDEEVLAIFERKLLNDLNAGRDRRLGLGLE